MRFGNRGQAVALDIMLVCICVSIFAVGIWSVSLGGKAPSSEAERSRQDYVKSMLITTLYASPEPGDPRYEAKSISDLIAMHLTNPEKMNISIIEDKLKEAKLGESLKEKVIGVGAEWFLYADSDLSGEGTRKICLHGKSGSDDIETCADGKVEGESVTSASADIVYPTSGSSGIFMKIPIFLIVKWS